MIYDIHLVKKINKNLVKRFSITHREGLALTTRQEINPYI
jgi:hypothetical protein